MVYSWKKYVHEGYEDDGWAQRVCLLEAIYDENEELVHETDIEYAERYELLSYL